VLIEQLVLLLLTPVHGIVSNGEHIAILALNHQVILFARQELLLDSNLSLLILLNKKQMRMETKTKLAVMYL
jgi:hypothetical protein